MGDDRQGPRRDGRVDRRARFSLLASGLRWRARSSLAMFVVAFVAVGIGAFGPIYLHGADQVVLDGTLAGAPPGNAGLSLVHTSGHGYPGPLLAKARSAPRPGPRGRWFGKPIVSQFVGIAPVVLVAGGPQTAAAVDARAGSERRLLARTTRFKHQVAEPYLGSLVSRTGVCRHLHIVEGECSTRRDQVVLSTRTAKLLGLQVGQQFLFAVTHSTRGASLLISGIYAPGDPTAPFWWGDNFFPYGTVPSSAAQQGYQLIVDDVFATAPTVRAVAPKGHLSALVQLPFVRHSLSVDQVGALRSSLAAYGQASLAHDVRVGTKLPAILDQAATVEHTATTIVAVVDLELVLLAIFVLYFVVSRTAAEREPDVRLAELRGFRPRTTLGVALAEPVSAVVVAVPVGFFGAWGLAEAVSPAVLGPGIGASPTMLGVYAALAAGVAGVAAAALGTRKALVAGVDPSGTATAAGGRWSAAGAVTIVVLAVAAFFELAVVGDAGSSGAAYDPLAAFAPGLLALALGVVCAHGLPGVLSATHRRTAGSPKVALVLATRLVARRRELSTQLVLVTIALALATFAVSGWAISGRNRDVRSVFGVGASKVLTVSPRPGTTFLSAVRSADPTGRYAMAAVVEQAPDGTTLAVDARRLPSVVAWPPEMGVSATQVGRRLLPHRRAPTVMVSGTEVAATVVTLADSKPRPNLVMDLFDIDTQTPEQVTFGPLVPGTHTYHGSLTFLCPGRCRLVDLSLTWAAPSATPPTAKAPTVSLDLLSLSRRSSGRWAPLHAGLGDVRRWTSPSGGARLAAGPGHHGISARVHLDAYGSPVTIAPADVPRALPVLVTPTSASEASGVGGPLVVGLDGGTDRGRTVGEVPALPGVGPYAALADLRAAELFQAGPMVTDTTEVWLASGAPPRIVAALRSRGLVVTGVQTAAAAVRALAHSGVTLAYLLYLMSAIAAGVLVVGATGFALSSGARRRQCELAALRAVGVGPISLRRSLWAEQAMVLIAGLVVGVVSGLVAAAVALRSVPEFVGHSAGPPLELGLPPLVLAVTIGVLAVALGGMTALGSAVVARGALVERLGSGQS